MIKNYKDLNVYQLSYRMAMELLVITKKLPKEELKDGLKGDIKMSLNVIL